MYSEKQVAEMMKLYGDMKYFSGKCSQVCPVCLTERYHTEIAIMVHETSKKIKEAVPLTLRKQINNLENKLREKESERDECCCGCGL